MISFSTFNGCFKCVMHSRNILFPNFYIDDEVRDMTLLKNDKLDITIVLVDSDYDGYNLEFIGVKNYRRFNSKVSAVVRI